MKSFPLLNRVDLIGFSASMGCAIHCLLLPFMISALPLLGLSVLADPRVEYSIILISFFLAMISVIHGLQKYQQQIAPLILIGLGFSVITLGLIIGHGQHDSSTVIMGSLTLSKPNEGLCWQDVITPLGAVLVSLGHLVNWRRIKK